MDEIEFKYDPESTEPWAERLTPDFVIIREGVEPDQPWAVGDEVTVIPIPIPMPRQNGSSMPKPTRRQRLRSWWQRNRLTVHRGSCHDHDDCDRCDEIAWENY